MIFGADISLPQFLVTYILDLAPNAITGFESRRSSLGWYLAHAQFFQE